MKNVQLFFKVITKKVYLLIVFVILSYMTSQIVATGTSLISDSIDAVLVSEVLEIKSLLMQISLLILAAMACSIIKKISIESCLLYTSPSPRDRQKSRMPSSA